MKISQGLSERAFAIVTESEVSDWIREVDIAAGGSAWMPLGGIPNNVHTVEVASDPALALVERPINGIDALLDLKARENLETAATPHIAAQKWWGVPPGGLASMGDERRRLADLLRVSMLESGQPLRPTITIQDAGTGQHPDDFPNTLLSLLASNKKASTHQMGVYNAGGAASYRFARATFIASRLAPQLLDGRADEVGITVVRYNPLDPDRFKSGTYEYLTAGDRTILRLDTRSLPDLPYGTYVKLIEYELSKYARAAQEPKSSLWHLFNGALPSPPLPLQIVETRTERFPGVRGQERRTVAGLLHLLSRKDVADYAEIRTVDLGPEMGHIELRYFVVNEGRDPDAYVSTDQGLTVTLNGQRQITRDRYWLKRNLELAFLYRRLIVVVDGTGLTNLCKRDIFSSTRETGVDTPAGRRLIDRVLTELQEDENLAALDELAKQRVLADATKTTTARVKKQLASQIASFVKGSLGGNRGGGKSPKAHKRGPRTPNPTPPVVDDAHLLDVPDQLQILNDPVRIHPGGTASLRISLNAKNDFLPTHSGGLTVVVGKDLANFIGLRAKGRLLGGQARLTLEAFANAPQIASSVQVAMIAPSLGVLLTATGSIDVKQDNQEQKKSNQGGEPDIDVQWVGRDKWTEFDPVWTGETVGLCNLKRDEPDNKETITRVEWILNEAFGPYDHVVSEKKLSETSLGRFREHYEIPVLYAMFKQRIAEEMKEREADEQGRAYEVPDDYVRGELARMARAVLMAMEPDLTVAESTDAA